MRLGFATVMALALGACATAKHYEGPARPAGELAVVLKEEALACNIMTVNGSFAGLMGGPTRLEFLPGRQVISVGYANVNAYSAWIDLPFDAVAGHIYRLQCVSDGKRWRPFLYDTTTKLIVSPQVG